MEASNLKFVMNCFFIQLGSDSMKTTSISNDKNSLFDMDGNPVFEISMNISGKFFNEFNELFGEAKKEKIEIVGNISATNFVWNVASDDGTIAFEIMLLIQHNCHHMDGNNKAFIKIAKSGCVEF